MAIELKTLGFKNFLSYGQNWTTYDFCSGVTRIAGSNGSGKSTVADALYFVLFGKAFRKINLPNLVNSTNKSELLVELTFNKNGKPFRIVRGIKPNILEIYDGDTLININANKNDLQTWFEREVLSFGSDIFDQIGIKSLTRYESFLTLPKGKKRNIIERLFGIEIISVMKDLNKDEIKTIEDKVMGFHRDRDQYERLLEQEGRHLDHLKSVRDQVEQTSQKKKEAYQTQNERTKKTIGRLYDELKQIEHLEGELEKTKVQRAKVASKIRKNSRLLSKQKQDFGVMCGKFDFMKSKCGDCPKIATFEADDVDTTTLQTSIKVLEEFVKELQAEEAHIDVDYDDLATKVMLRSRIEGGISEKKSNIANNNKLIREVVTDVVVDETKYNEYTKKLHEITFNMSEIETELKYLIVRGELLKDTGIRSSIIRTYLPILNRLLNSYLQKFSIGLEVAFNSQLDMDIGTKFKENFKYDNFSEGEKKRINLAITFCFLEFTKLKHSNASLNLLILDEFNSGLDPEGESTMYEILKDAVVREGKEVITITQTAIIDPDNISRLYNVQQVYGFSDLTLVEDR